MNTKIFFINTLISTSRLLLYNPVVYKYRPLHVYYLLPLTQWAKPILVRESSILIETLLLLQLFSLLYQ